MHSFIDAENQRRTTLHPSWVASGFKSVSQGTKLASLSSKKELRSLERNFEWSSCEKDEKREGHDISRSLFTTNAQPEEFTRMIRWRHTENSAWQKLYNTI